MVSELLDGRIVDGVFYPEMVDCEWCDAIDGDGVHYVNSNGPYDDPNCTNGHEGGTDAE